MDLVGRMRHAGSADERRRAAAALGELADDVAAPALRLAWHDDASAEVREAAAIALGRRGDPAAIDSFVAALESREDRGRAAAVALGQAGDVRGVAALLAALVEGWKPVLVGDSLRHAGAVVLPALRALADAQPALRKRKVVKELLAPPS
jgi:HEAT repeat protein